MAKPPKSRTQTILGIVRAHNISPKGEVEGVLVETSEGTVQVNLPKHDRADARFAVGSKLEVAAEPEDDEGEHPVFELAVAAGTVEGPVVRLNYARHGEVNGYHLATGVFVHVKPDGAKRYKVKVGDTITAEGESRTGADAVVLEASSVKKRAHA